MGSACKILPFVLFLLQLNVAGQIDSIATEDPPMDPAKKMLRVQPEDSPCPGNGDFQPVVQWPWEFIGPAVQPVEVTAGGKGIPAYAAGRGNGTGRINYLFVHPKNGDKLWACSPTGGLWFTKNGGKQWLEGGTDRLPVSGVSSVAVNLRRPRQWVIATGDSDDQFMYTDGIWITRNEGKTYRSLNGNDPSTALPFCDIHDQTFIGEVACLPDDFNHLFVASSKGLWECENIAAEGFASRRNKRTRRGSLKWKRLLEGQFYDIEFISEPGKSTVIVAAGENLALSFDGGNSWETMPDPEYPESEKYPFLRMSVEYSPALPNFVYVATTCSERASASKIGSAVLYLFDIRARQWKKICQLNNDVTNIIPTRARAFAVDPLNAEKVFVANVQPVHISTDGGLTFSKIEKNQMHDDLHHIVISPKDGRVWASHDGGVSMSEDGGLHWKNRDHGIGAANVFGVSTSQTSDPQFAFGAYDTGGNLFRNNKWTHVSWGDGFETIISPSDSRIVFTTMQNGNIQATYDGDVFSESIHTNSKTPWHTWIRMHPQDHQTIFCSGERLVRSDDLGRHWKTIFDCAKMDSTLATVFRFYLSDVHPGTMYVYAFDKATAVNPQIWRTHNVLEKDPAAIVWERVPFIPQEGWISNISIDPQDASHFWLLYARLECDGKIWYYDGSKYNDLSLNLHDSKCESMILERGASRRLYIGTNHGVFTKAWQDKEWTLMKGLPGTYIKSLDINYVTGKIVAGTFGRGIWQAPLFR